MLDRWYGNYVTNMLSCNYEVMIKSHWCGFDFYTNYTCVSGKYDVEYLEYFGSNISAMQCLYFYS